jgi:hypothetical protein
MKRKKTAKASAKNRLKTPANTKPAKLQPARRAARSTHTGNPIDAMVAAWAQVLGIALDPSWQGSIAFNLRLILSHAAKVESFPLPDEAEPAPIFHA